MVEPSIRDLLDRADTARSAGEGAAAAALYATAVDSAREQGDLDTWTRAALGAAAVHLFGTEPGRLPAQLYDVLAHTVDDVDRARLAAALARVWAYSGYPDRGLPFSDEALQRAEHVGDPGLLADCLDAALATHWGPDDLDQRVALTARLSEVAAHVLDPTARLQATLWNLEVACQSLDIPGMYRHLRTLEMLGEESARAEFFAASRRLTLDLLHGRVDTVSSLVAIAERAGRQAGLADWWMVVESMKAYGTLHVGNHAECALSAAACAEFGRREGNVTVLAEAAFLWSMIGHRAQAVEVLGGVYGDVLDNLPRDTNWLLTIQCVLLASAITEQDEVVSIAERLLGPYEGRAVFNTGAVSFNGVTDHALALAATRRGDAVTAERLRERALATYERLGATWWRDRVLADLPEGAVRPRLRLHPGPAGDWLVGPSDDPVHLVALRGLSHLRRLLERPGETISAIDLATDAGPTVVQSDLGASVDRKALDAYRRRLDELDEEIAGAQDDADLARLEPLHDERDALLEEVAAATGLAGRTRTTGSTHERARVTVTKAINTAMQRVLAAHPPTGEHLKRSIHTGTTCGYQPDEPVSWILVDQSLSTGA